MLAACSDEQETVNLNPPTDFEVGYSCENDVIHLTWDFVSNATGYEVYAFDGGKLTCIYLCDGDQNSCKLGESSFNGQDLFNDMWYYKVKATNSLYEVESEFSESVAFMVREYQDITVTNKEGSYADGAITLSWDPVDEAVLYRIFRRQNTDDFSTIGTTTNAKFTDTDVEQSEEYDYCMRVFFEKGRSYYAYPFDDITCLSAPTSLTGIYSSSTGNVSLSWSSVSGALCYNVYKSSSNESYKLFGQLYGNNCSDINPTEGINYYKVSAVYDDRESELSDFFSVNVSL